VREARGPRIKDEGELKKIREKPDEGDWKIGGASEEGRRRRDERGGRWWRTVADSCLPPMQPA